jgi:Cof subfamily protein (haloacid dehalogenase superfamily)
MGRAGHDAAAGGPPLAATRLVVSDLDGTLLRSDGTLSRRTMDVLAQVHDSGVEVIFATARPARAAMRRLADLPFRGTVICSNGAAVFDAATERLYRVRPLPRREALEIVDFIRSHFGSAVVAVDGTAGRVMDPGWPPASSSVPGQATLWPMTGEMLPALKMICLMVVNAWSDYRDVPDRWSVTVTSSAAGLIEFSASSATKLSALRWYCRRRGIALGNVIAFGDMPNDIDLLTAVGTGVAVANAHLDVLSAVPWRTESNDEDGVAAFLEGYVLAARAGRAASTRTTQ